MEQYGTVIRKPQAVGSKSGRLAVMLKTVDGEYVLRIQGGNPFHDDRLEQLVGKDIRAFGEIHGYTLLMQKWSEE